MTFFTRHRRKFALAFGFIFGFAAVSAFAFSAFKTRLLDFQARKAADQTSRELIRRKFDQNQTDADITAAALVGPATEPVLAKLPVERVTAELQANQSVKTKKELWSELKMTTVARAVSVVYVLSVLVFFTRLQLNLLGRENYIQSVKDMIDTDGDVDMQDITDETNRRFLTFSWWLLSHGHDKIIHLVNEATQSTFSSLTPKTELTFDTLEDLMSQVHDKIDIKTHILSIVLPSEDEEYVVLTANPTERELDQETEAKIKKRVRVLLDEAKDLTESPDGAFVIDRLISEGSRMLLSNLYQSLYSVDAESVKLASILAGIARQAHEMVITKYNNQYLSGMNSIPELNTFSAIVYSLR
ncbi:Peroxin-3 [Lipomyces arxii]|uniref:Peroxin-3 n=1 Tax=Lipomyces arxii TaxID=56418 RepID=UPI0034CD1CB9